jgi:hypothetical protein
VDAEIGKMIPQEMRAGDAPANDENSDYDHMERLHYVDTEVTQEEKTSALERPRCCSSRS